jgi:hypothetical protein
MAARQNMDVFLFSRYSLYLAWGRYQFELVDMSQQVAWVSLKPAAHPEMNRVIALLF